MKNLKVTELEQIRNYMIIEQLDFIIISGDAYVDSPSFSTAIIGRTIESQSFTIGIIVQPNWHDCEDFKRLGKPKYGFLFNPITGEEVYIPKTPEEKEMQRALIQFAVPKNYQKVKKALIKAHREDLISSGKYFLIGFYPGKLGYECNHKNNSKSSIDNINKSSSNSSNRKSVTHKNNDPNINNKSSSNRNLNIPKNNNSKNTSDINSKSNLGNSSNKNTKNSDKKNNNTKKRVH